jgi:ferredoxin
MSESEQPNNPSNFPDNIDKKKRNTGTLRRIVVDRAKCIGARSCVAVAPGVFQMDDENLAYIVDPDSDDDDTILLAAQSCPVLAIILYDEQGKKIFPEE